MTTSAAQPASGHLVDPRGAPALDVLGPAIQYLTPPDGPDDSPCVMRGTVPPGVAVPLHSHGDPETFLMVAGALEGLTDTADGFVWVPVRSGDVFHVPGGAKHAWRNPHDQPAVSVIVSTVRMGRFFRELGTLARGAGVPPSEEAIRGFHALAERYGYWNAGPRENAAVGLRV